jgi:hypothetical protein
MRREILQSALGCARKKLSTRKGDLLEEWESQAARISCKITYTYYHQSSMGLAGSGPRSFIHKPPNARKETPIAVWVE